MKPTVGDGDESSVGAQFHVDRGTADLYLLSDWRDEFTGWKPRRHRFFSNDSKGRSSDNGQSQTYDDPTQASDMALSYSDERGSRVLRHWVLGVGRLQPHGPASFASQR